MLYLGTCGVCALESSSYRKCLDISPHAHNHCCGQSFEQYAQKMTDIRTLFWTLTLYNDNSSSLWHQILATFLILFSHLLI